MKTDAELTGVQIEGTPKVYQKLTAKISPENLQEISYQWYRDETPITEATQETYQLSVADIGHQVTVRATQTVDQIADKEETIQEGTVEKEDTIGPVTKEDGEETDQPELDQKATRFITIIVEKREMDEFSIDGGKTWQ